MTDTLLNPSGEEVSDVPMREGEGPRRPVLSWPREEWPKDVPFYLTDGTDKTLEEWEADNPSEAALSPIVIPPRFPSLLR